MLVVLEMAEGVRFELTRPFGLPVFKTGAINRSATPPEKLSLDFAIVSAIGNQLQIVGQALRLPFFGLAGEAPALPSRNRYRAANCFSRRRAHEGMVRDT